MHFIPDELDDYVVNHSENEPELLKQLTRETYQKILQPIMLSGPYQGRVLSMISKLVNPKTILELDPQSGDTSFGGSGFKRAQYALSWKKWQDKDFRLVLTNIPHNNSKLLLMVPDEFKKDVSMLLKDFAQSLLK